MRIQCFLHQKAKEITEYFVKAMKEITTKELREFLMKYLREERKITESSINYYNIIALLILAKVTIVTLTEDNEILK